MIHSDGPRLRRNAPRLRVLPSSRARDDEGSVEERRMLARIERAWHSAPPSAPGRAMQHVHVRAFERQEPAA